ncbi:hypothetical protein EHS17_07250 [Rhodobacteraceae bacterium CH30]|nr:hypothetical protein EHS17_07250 [Rhodobacteraceae bacterium CH30]
MNTQVPHARLNAALAEAHSHLSALQEALADWQLAQPVTGLAQIDGDKALKRLSDQLLFRFIKLQDALGMRLIPATLAVLAEPFEAWPMQDRLNRLEKLGYLSSNQWLQWRDIRNRLAHEYPDDIEGRWANLQQAIQAAGEMVQCYLDWLDKLEQRA